MQRRGVKMRLAVSVLLVATVCACSTLSPALAEFPERPVTVFVSSAAGGSPDMSLRALALGAEKYLGQPIVVENKGGAGGTLALAHVANAKPDGYTLAQAGSTAIVRAPQLQKVTYKPLKSFTPIMAYVGVHNTGLAVKSDAPWKNMRELISYAKKNPGKLRYGSPGVGSVPYHAMEYVARKEGIKWVHVPYTGSVPVITAVLGGHIEAGSVGPEWVSYVHAGTLRILATHEKKRSAAFPNIPTFRELGFDFVNETVFSVFGPAGLAPDVLKKLETAFTKGMETPQFKSVVEKLNLIPAYYNSKDYDRFLKDSWVKLEKSMKETGMIKEPATPPY
jgi:tripartite-type tricarboxylate transporter receptor subunit TctC